MCKKLTKLVLESEATRDELAKYQSAFGDVDAARQPEDRQGSIHSRESEFKGHLKLLEEEAMLLSRRIVELEVENRGLRAEMSDLREKSGGGGEEDVSEEHLPQTGRMKDGEGSLETRPAICLQQQTEESGNRSLLYCGSQTDQMSIREGPVGGEQDPSTGQETDTKKTSHQGLKGTTAVDNEILLALRDQSCILTSAIQLLMTPSRPEHSPHPFSPLTDGKPQGSLLEALDLLQVMLLAFIGKVNLFLKGEDEHRNGVLKEEVTWDLCTPSFLCTSFKNMKELESKKEHLEERQKTNEVKQRGAANSCKDPTMQLSLQILWILHRWSNVQEKQVRQRKTGTTNQHTNIFIAHLQPFR